jgi:ribose transport system ATP-binding protein
VLSVTGISKSFFGVRVLSDFEISIDDGEVHALLGHNGSGKSTLIKILSGYYEPDDGAGVVMVSGQQLRLGDTANSASLGIGVVHQGLSLIPSLTVLENLRLGPGQFVTAPGRRIRWRDERARALTQLAEVGLTDVPPEARFASLSAVQQTGVAIARARQEGVRCLILDEPTSALPEQEVGRLIEIIRNMQAQGVSILYVTHRLDEVPRVAQRVTVLRDGVIVGSGPMTEFPQSRLIQLIANTRADAEPAPPEPAAGEPAEPPASETETSEPKVSNTQASNTPASDIQASNTRASEPVPAVTAPAPRGGRADLEFADVSTGTLDHLSFTAAAGTVIGIASLVGAGVEDIPEVLQGDLPYTGEIRVGGKIVRLRGPRSGQDQGLHVVPSRVSEKIIEDFGVRENLTLGLQSRFFSRGWLNNRAERQFAQRLVKSRGIRTANLNTPSRLLSGGNKQKVVMARALELAPRVLVVNEPTNGIDVAGKQEILRLLRAAAAAGTTVILCSSELEDLAGACSRLLVLVDGHLTAELTGAQITRERILEEMHSDAR